MEKATSSDPRPAPIIEDINVEVTTINPRISKIVVAKVYCLTKISRHNILVAIGFLFKLFFKKKKRVFLKNNSDPKNFVTYLLMEIFLWNQMRTKILEDFIIMSRLLRSFLRISFRSNSSSSTSSRNSNLLNDQDNQTQEVAPKHNLFDEEV